MSNSKYFKELEIEQTSSIKEIKKAYKKCLFKCPLMIYVDNKSLTYNNDVENVKLKK